MKRNCHLWDAVAHQVSISCGTVEYTQRDGTGDTLRFMNHSLGVWHIVSVFKWCVVFPLQNLVNLTLAFLWKCWTKRHSTLWPHFSCVPLKTFLECIKLVVCQTLVVQTLNIWMSDEVEESCKEGVGRGVSPSKVQLYQMHHKLHLSKRGAIKSLLKTSDIMHLHIQVSTLHPGVKVTWDDSEQSPSTLRENYNLTFFLSIIFYLRPDRQQDLNESPRKQYSIASFNV